MWIRKISGFFLFSLFVVEVMRIWLGRVKFRISQMAEHNPTPNIYNGFATWALKKFSFSEIRLTIRPPKTHPVTMLPTKYGTFIQSAPASPQRQLVPVMTHSDNPSETGSTNETNKINEASDAMESNSRPSAQEGKNIVVDSGFGYVHDLVHAGAGQEIGNWTLAVGVASCASNGPGTIQVGVNTIFGMSTVGAIALWLWRQKK
ncbi:hypothetical protein F4781DRAFT_316255 [Annulohypoxylon bovei var. microspora]|nr:hypothetical protein F4781DRAFT_316255 [Annulohypoxylon bovei var. microspora]